MEHGKILTYIKMDVGVHRSVLCYKIPFTACSRYITNKFLPLY